MGQKMQKIRENGGQIPKVLKFVPTLTVKITKNERKIKMKKLNKI